MKYIDRRTSDVSTERIAGLRCPYSGASVVCNASLFRLKPSTSMTSTFCDTDHYDDCPLFLAKVLRKRWG